MTTLLNHYPNEKLQEFRENFPYHMQSLVERADMLFERDQKPDSSLAAFLSEAYKITSMLEPEQGAPIIIYREQVREIIEANDLISANQKAALLYKATFVILRDAVSGKLPELQGNYINDYDQLQRSLVEVYMPSVENVGR